MLPLILLLPIFLPSVSPELFRNRGHDLEYERLAMKVTSKMLNAFDKDNSTEFEDFDVNFFFEDCNRTYNGREFLELARKYRKTLARGTSIKYALINAQSTAIQYKGILYEMHFEILGQHHDMLVNLQQTHLSNGDRWRWVHSWKNNCIRNAAHSKPFYSDFLREKILS